MNDDCEAQITKLESLRRENDPHFNEIVDITITLLRHSQGAANLIEKHVADTQAYNKRVNRYVTIALFGIALTLSGVDWYFWGYL